MLSAREAARHNRHNEFYDRIMEYERLRRRFVYKVYTLMAIFVFLTFTQWLMVLYIDKLRNFFHQNIYVAMIGTGIALLFVSIFICCDQIRFIIPFNWLITAVIVESITFGLAPAMLASNVDFFYIIFAVVSLTLMLMTATGRLIPRDLTRDITILSMGAMFFFVGSLLFFLLAIATNISINVVVFSSIMILIVLVFSVYHAQIIAGGRYGEMRLNDFLMGALLVYKDFIVLFILAFFIISVITKKQSFDVYDDKIAVSQSYTYGIMEHLRNKFNTNY